MRKTIKKSLAVLLALLMLSGSFVCFAAELNPDAVNAHYGQYKNYLLLGDSVACGYRDQITENDEKFNDICNETTYYRVPGSYADVLANAIIEDKSMTALAGPGYRTIEMRYMLEDDYDYDDAFMFHDTADPDVMKARIPMYRQNIAEADLITLGVGGNDFGTMITWLVADIMEEQGMNPKLVEALRKIGNEAGSLGETIDKVVDLANTMKALPALLEAVPAALANGLVTFFTNWNIMIEDIYALNPDATLLVIGMFDNAIK
jgi:lysophospholipase L1-like esterase